MPIARRLPRWRVTSRASVLIIAAVIAEDSIVAQARPWRMGKRAGFGGDQPQCKIKFAVPRERSSEHVSGLPFCQIREVFGSKRI